MAAYVFASPVDVDIKLEGEDERKQVDVKLEKERTVSCPVYYDGDAVAGQVRAPYHTNAAAYSAQYMHSR